MSTLKKAIEYLSQDYLLNAPFIEALTLNQASLLNVDGDGVAALHNEEDILMLSLTSDNALLKYADLIREKVSTIYGARDLNLIGQYFKGFRQVPCHQLLYTKKQPPALSGLAEFKLLDESHAQFVLDIYSNKSFTLSTIKRLIERGLIFGVYVDGTIAGFCGRHREGAMGLLEILPEFRRRGLGMETEKFIIAEVLREGKIPYGHVVYGNEVSMNLQRQIEGIEFSDKMLLWHVLPKLQ